MWGGKGGGGLWEEWGRGSWEWDWDRGGRRGAEVGQGGEMND